MNRHVMLAIMLFLGTFTVWAEDSIRVSAADLHALLERVERLEQAQKHTNKLGYDSIDAVSGASKPMPKDTVTDQPPTTNDHQRRFYIGGYGEVTAKHCWFSNSYLRYGKNPEKYANDHFGEFDLPHGWIIPAMPTKHACTTPAHVTSSKPSCGMAIAVRVTPTGLRSSSTNSIRKTAMPSSPSSMPSNRC